MLTLQPTFRLLSLCALMYLMGGCSWTPQVETTIYEGPQVSVSLITVSEESFEADHPVTLQTDTIEHILRGLQIRRSNRLLQKIFSGEATPQRVFTEEHIALLTPPLQKAFSQVTPEEHIIFQTTGTYETRIRSTKGTMYVQGDDLYVSLTFLGQGSHTTTKAAGKGSLTDQVGHGKPHVMFSPKEALRTEAQSHWLQGLGEKSHVVINVPLLASLHRQHPAQTGSTEQEKSKSLSTSAPKFERTISKETDEATRIISTPSPSVQTLESPDTKTLIEEIKTLRKELAEQKKAIEQLKEK